MLEYQRMTKTSKGPNGQTLYKTAKGWSSKKPVANVSQAKSLNKKQKQEVKNIVDGLTIDRYNAEQLTNALSGGYVNFNSVINSSADWYRCLPLIGQGTASHQRMENLVRPKSCKLHFELRFSKADIKTRDVYAVLFVLNPKFQKEYAATSVNSVLSAKYDEFLKLGNDTNISYGGTWPSSTFPVQTNDFSLLHKRIVHLERPSGDQNGDGVTGDYSGTGTGMYSVAGSLRKTLTLNIKCPNLKYSKASDLLPNNYAPVWACGYYYANGTTPDSTGGLLAVSCRTEMTFE